MVLPVGFSDGRVLGSNDGLDDGFEEGTKLGIWLGIRLGTELFVGASDG